ncbi:hypothetical protein HELRODRAFT_192994 [Helobdella robusta]|uniref:Diphthine--ammonia ligase n=1 Tax=Helobdella robusta TaxID=6412 RepID=T1FUH7_HELRO|nr:hypothetical protein HELRODRAFT_192994 [Helobdella robusta]ESN98574.1 hypothetical protein HELRODRAFT_192994 [Helobdella robusta]
MKVLGLISGGKDSCFNMMKCVELGHEIVALANLYPPNSGELDSYMYQSVGHEIIDLYSKAMQLPLFRRPILGKSQLITAEYKETIDDEVEDLYMLLKEVMESIEIEAVSVGAILSEYQNCRVEHVCRRLNLKPLCLLWQRDQLSLLDEMIDSNIQAVIVKVASLGLNEAHLLKSLSEMREHLVEMNKKYGLNVCGEGGEYETITLDCPLFKSYKIKLDEVRPVLHTPDPYTPVAYVSILKSSLLPKSLT